MSTCNSLFSTDISFAAMIHYLFYSLPLLPPPSPRVLMSQSVVDLIKTCFGDKTSVPDPPPIPQFLVPSHEVPRFSCFVESEAAGVSFY